MAVLFGEFCAKFNFDKARRGHVGVEREYFLADQTNTPVPRSPEFLAAINDPAWTYELSACQVEHRTIPHGTRSGLLKDLDLNQRRGRDVARGLGLVLLSQELASAHMSTAIYPHDERYAGIAQRIGPKNLLAACRVAGVHLHLGMSDLDHAIQVHNALIPRIPELCAMGDHSGGERLRQYAAMAIRGMPPPFQSVLDFYTYAHEEGFAENPRDCWNLVRISRHGTVELRMFGMTGDVNEIMGWVAHVTSIAGL